MTGNIRNQRVAIFQDRTKSATIYHLDQTNVQHKVFTIFIFRTGGHSCSVDRTGQPFRYRIMASSVANRSTASTRTSTPTFS